MRPSPSTSLAQPQQSNSTHDFYQAESPNGCYFSYTQASKIRARANKKPRPRASTGQLCTCQSCLKTRSTVTDTYWTFSPQTTWLRTLPRPRPKVYAFSMANQVLPPPPVPRKAVARLAVHAGSYPSSKYPLLQLPPPLLPPPTDRLLSALYPVTPSLHAQLSTETSLAECPESSLVHRLHPVLTTIKSPRQNRRLAIAHWLRCVLLAPIHPHAYYRLHHPCQRGCGASGRLCKRRRPVPKIWLTNRVKQRAVPSFHGANGPFDDLLRQPQQYHLHQRSPLVFSISRS